MESHYLKSIKFFLPKELPNEIPKVDFHTIALKIADECNHDKKLFRIPKQIIGKSYFVCLKCAQEYSDKIYKEHINVREIRKNMYIADVS